MSIHFQSGRALVGVLVLAFPVIFALHLFQSKWWLIGVPAGLVALLLLVASLPMKRRVTPQQWGAELEKHLLGTDGQWGWDNATSVRLADKNLERLRLCLVPHFDMLDTPEKKDEFRQIVGALKRGELSRATGQGTEG